MKTFFFLQKQEIGYILYAFDPILYISWGGMQDIIDGLDTLKY